jgi:hypothetical protein
MSTFRFVCLAFWGSTFLAAAQGQNPVVIKKINFSLENVPEYVTSGGSNKAQGGVSSAQKWVVMEVEFDTSPEWINEVTIEVFLLIQNGNQQFNIEGTGIYQDIEKGQSHKVAMYLSPQTYKRYSGVATQQAIKDVAVKVTLGGAVVDTYSDKMRRGGSANRRWWELVAPQKAILRTLKDTPWYPIYSGYYEQLKPNQNM